MTWTYNGNLHTSSIDRVRFTIGDTIQDDPLLMDEEITAILAIYPDDAAAKCAMAIAAKFSRMADVSVGDVKTQHQGRAASYMQMAKDLKNETYNIVPSVALDTEEYAIQRGMHDG